MYFELTAPDRLSLEMAYWEAQVNGLDPEFMPPLTFNIGTGSIEKVSNLRDKFNLTETYTAEFEPTGYQKGADMSDYKAGFEDGVRFAREVIVENIREWVNDAEGAEAQIIDEIADRIEFGTATVYSEETEEDDD